MDKQKSRIDMLDHAISYAENGFRIFPCVPGEKRPACPNGLNDATNDLEQVEAWWTENPQYNIGLNCADLIVLDVDGVDWPADPEKTATMGEGAALQDTPRGGWHYVYRKPEGAPWKNSASSIAHKVDTRTNGGYIVVAPSVTEKGAYAWRPGYELESVEDLATPPGWLNDILNQSVGFGSEARETGETVANDIPSGVRNHTMARFAGHMRRAGASEAEILSALLTMNNGRCKPPMPRDEVERIARSVARYEPDIVTVAVIEDHWSQDQGATTCEVQEAQEPGLVDPGPVPGRLMHIPGFCAEVMDWCMESAPYPNLAMAFCGAMSIQAHLAARKVQDAGGLRTNLYILGLALSASGKDWPRKINKAIAMHAQLQNSIKETFASGEGIQDALMIEPAQLYQTDEVDTLLQTLNSPKADPRIEGIMQALLSMYTSADTMVPMRTKAGGEAKFIDQPCLNLFGTAVPQHYYDAISQRMLTNGLFARCFVVESLPRGEGQEPQAIDCLPDAVLKGAEFWRDYNPNRGNMVSQFPRPYTVYANGGAHEILAECRVLGDTEYKEAEAKGDNVGAAVWGRFNEQARKLSLIYACSADALNLEIREDAAEWAREMAYHQAQRMLYQVGQHVAENAHHKTELKVKRVLKEAGGSMRHGDLLRRMRMKAREFRELMDGMVESGAMEAVAELGATKKATIYKVLR